MRDDIPWTTLKYEELSWWNRDDKPVRLLPVFWDKVSPTPWLQYREVIKNFAARHCNGTVVLADDVLKMQFDDDDIFIPFDDDDWFHEDIVGWVESIAQDYEFGWWDSVMNHCVHVYGIHSYSHWNKAHVCSNCYFVRGRMLRRMDMEDATSMLKEHYNSHDLALNYGYGDVLDRSDVQMSVYNWHPGSISTMYRLYTRSAYKKLFPRPTAPRGVVPKRWSWAQPTIDDFRDYIQELAKGVYKEPKFL